MIGNSFVQRFRNIIYQSIGLILETIPREELTKSNEPLYQAENIQVVSSKPTSTGSKTDFRNFSIQWCFLIEILRVWVRSLQLILDSKQKEFNRTQQMILWRKVVWKSKTFQVFLDFGRYLFHLAVSKWFIPVLWTTFGRFYLGCKYQIEQS